MALTVGAVAAVLDEVYPPRLAEPWDVVGLAVGSLSRPVTRVGYTVDCTSAVVDEAVAAGADLVVAHHPPFLHGLPALNADDPKGRLAEELVRAGISVFVAHTNADVPPDGVAATLAERLGVCDPRPLRPCPTDALDKIITFVPAGQLEQVVDALAAAGAGAIGSYRRCSFRVAGEGTFTPLEGSNPYAGEVGRAEQVAETRVEMVLPRLARPAVVAALLATHPYETPAYDVIELASEPSRDTGLGRVGELSEPVRLSEFAQRVTAAIPSTPRGVLVGGDPDRLLHRVAVQAGSGADLLDDARAAGADVYVTSDLRHHQASEALAWPGAPALIDIPHWAAEWPWLLVVQRLVHERLGIGSYVSSICTDPWTTRN